MHEEKKPAAMAILQTKCYAGLAVQDQTIMIEHIGTEFMLADPLTKGLPPSNFRNHVAGMGLLESL